MNIQTHCPNCRRLLSIPELVEMWCEACNCECDRDNFLPKPTNVQPGKRVA